MVSPTTTELLPSTNLSLNHVNLNIDVIISNTAVEDLRAIIRTLLATSNRSTMAAFCSSARAHAIRTAPKSLPSPTTLFTPSPTTGLLESTVSLHQLIAHSRVLCGAGMGRESLKALLCIVRGTIGTGMNWDEDGDVANVLCEVDCDIAGVLIAIAEEIKGLKRVGLGGLKETVSELRESLLQVRTEAEERGCDNPFERGLEAVLDFRI